jgi:hypothetical protein
MCISINLLKISKINYWKLLQKYSPSCNVTIKIDLSVRLHTWNNLTTWEAKWIVVKLYMSIKGFFNPLKFWFNSSNGNGLSSRHIYASFSEHLDTNSGVGRAVAQRLDAGFPPRRHGFAYGQHVGFVVDKAALGQVFSEYFGFPC